MNEISVPLQISRQQEQMKIGVFAARAGFFLKSIAWRNVDLATHDRLNPLLFRCLIKLDRPI